MTKQQLFKTTLRENASGNRLMFVTACVKAAHTDESLQGMTMVECKDAAAKLLNNLMWLVDKAQQKLNGKPYKDKLMSEAEKDVIKFADRWTDKQTRPITQAANDYFNCDIVELFYRADREPRDKLNYDNSAVGRGKTLKEE